MTSAYEYDSESWGKRQFKGGAPLAQSKGGTILASDGVEKTLDGKTNLLDSLRKQSVSKVNPKTVPTEIKEKIEEIEFSPSLLEKVEKETQNSLLSRGE